MAVELRVTGAEHLRALGKDLRAMGEEGKGLRRELLRSMRASARPLIPELRASAREVLPKKGGLNEFIASSKITVANKLTGNKVGTRIVAKKSGGGKGWHDLEAFDAGSFRHPVYGKWRKGTKPQSITPGWFTKPANKAAPEQRAALMEAMSVVEAKITHGK